MERDDFDVFEKIEELEKEIFALSASMESTHLSLSEISTEIESIGIILNDVVKHIGGNCDQ